MIDRSHPSLEPVLMLVPYFAPQTHAAMFRAHKLAKYLPEYGFRPVVVTTDINYLYNEDPGLLAELPETVEIHRARFVEPTVRGVRMALGGRDRTFAALKRADAVQIKAHTNQLASGIGGGRSWSAEIIRLLGEWPDRYWTWSLTAWRLCHRLIREQGIRLLYTSAVPVTPLVAAGSLQQRYGIKWLADFRDPVGYGQKHSTRGVFKSALERRILEGAMRSANLITGLADSYGNIFFDLYGLPESRYRFIPTGLDEAYCDVAAKHSRDTGVLLYVGEVMPNQSPHAFEVLGQVYRLAPERMKDFRLVFIGRREINEPRIRALTAVTPDWPYPIEFIDHLPQPQLYQMIQRARACLLIPGQRRYWWTNFAKLVDYLALGCPVIADVPPISEAREELSKVGTGFFMGGECIDTDARELLGWLDSDVALAPSDYRQHYTAHCQAAAFAGLFNELLSEERRG